MVTTVEEKTEKKEDDKSELNKDPKSMDESKESNKDSKEEVEVETKEETENTSGTEELINQKSEQPAEHDEPKEHKEESKDVLKEGSAAEEEETIKEAPTEKAEEGQVEGKEEDLKEEQIKEPKSKKSKEKKDKEKMLLFNKYDLEEIELIDSGLVRYINLEPIILPHVSARYANKKFGKIKVNVVERLINNMMRTEKYTGKKFKAYNVVKNSFEIVAKRTKKNPLQILIQALENGAPKEEIVRLRFGGILVPKSVDSSPSRRLDIALRNICKGAVKSSHKNRKDISTCLAEEIILASKNDMNSFAINKKEDIERVAASAR